MFKRFDGIASGVIGTVLEQQSGQAINIVDFFTETVGHIWDSVQRRDPEKPLLRDDFSSPRAIADRLIDGVTTGMGVGYVIQGDNERALVELCTTWREALGQPERENVAYRRGDYDKCMSLNF